MHAGTANRTHVISDRSNRSEGVSVTKTNRKRTVEECLALDANKLSRAGAFRAAPGTPCSVDWRGTAGIEILRADFVVSGEPTRSLIQIRHHFPRSRCEVARTVHLAQEPCHFGGSRYVFRCPGRSCWTSCGRLVRKLYLVDGSWLCRGCGHLTYTARQRHDRRSDFLLRNPLALALLLESRNGKHRLRAIGALVHGVRSGKFGGAFEKAGPDGQSSVRRYTTEGDYSIVTQLSKPALQPMPQLPKLVSLEELSRHWGLPLTWLREACRTRCADPLPVYRCGRYVRVDLNDPALAAWIQRRRVAGVTDDYRHRSAHK